MKRFLGTTLIISGTIFSLFVLNLLLFTYNDSYRNALEKAVLGENYIPVVAARGANVGADTNAETGKDSNAGYDSFRVNENQSALNESGKTENLAAAKNKAVDKEKLNKGKKGKASNPSDTLASGNETKSVSKDVTENENKPAVVDKEYHEDCGTGKGYWIIRYADGSVGVE